MGLALGLVAVEGPVVEPAVNGLGEFPAQVRYVAEAGVEALAGERRHHVRGVARQEDIPGPPGISDQAIELIDDRALHRPRADPPVRSEQLGDEFLAGLFARHALAGEKQELVPAAT